MQLLHDEDDIEEELPDPESVIEGLSQKVKNRPHRSKDSSLKGKGVPA
jgi:hypothetical protein